MSNINFKKLAEKAFIKNMITKIHPSGDIALVCDTFDFWSVVSDILPDIKADIMSRNGRLVIRPDSGDPVDIICGLSAKDGYSVVEMNGKLHLNDSEKCVSREVSEAECKGLISYLWETFGGTYTDNGYKVIDSHIGAIYGDSITYDRAEQILNKLYVKGFASNNIVFGIGSYTYQMVSRDTHGMAIKSTHAVINGKNVPIFKNPKTDSGMKVSANGYLMVSKENGKYTLWNDVTSKQEKHGCLETVFEDGFIKKTYSLADIRDLTRL